MTRLKLLAFLICFLMIFGGASATMEIQSPETTSFRETGMGAEPGVSGDVGFSVPIGTVTGRGGLDLPISLNYGSGIRLDQEASWVGLGFNLGLGAISRNPIGIPDDYSNGFLNTGAGDYGDQDYYSVNFPGGGGKIIFDSDKTPHMANWAKYNITLYNSNGVKYEDYTGDNFQIYRWVITTVDGTRYIFGGGFQGTSSDANSRSSIPRVDTAVTTIVGQAGSGDIYYGDGDTRLSTPFVSSWYLTAILSPDYVSSDADTIYGSSWDGPKNADEGNWARVEYQSEGDYKYIYPDPRGFDECDLNCGGECLVNRWTNCDNTNPCAGGNPYYALAYYEYSGLSRNVASNPKTFSTFFTRRDSNIEMVYPKKIITPASRAEFVYNTNDRVDGMDHSEINGRVLLDDYCGDPQLPPWTFGYNTGGATPKKLGKLTEIKFCLESDTSCSNPTNGVIFDYRTSSEQELAEGANNQYPNRGRLTLDHLSFYGLNSASMPDITFEYEDESLPYHRYAWDWWGHNNGKTGPTGNSYPHVRMLSIYCKYLTDNHCNNFDWDVIYSFFEGTAPGYDNNPYVPHFDSTDSADAWSISKVQYSTGGEIEYVYELGDYSYERDQSLGSTKAGGFRLKEKTVNDGFGGEYTTDYEYGTGHALQHLDWRSRYRVDWTMTGPHFGNGIFYETVQTNVPRNHGNVLATYDLSGMGDYEEKLCERDRKIDDDKVTKVQRDVLVDYIPHTILSSGSSVRNESDGVLQETSQTYEVTPKAFYSDSLYDSSEDKIDCNGGLGSSRTEPYYLNASWLKLTQTDSTTNELETKTTYSYNLNNGLPQNVDTYGNDNLILRQNTKYAAYNDPFGDQANMQQYFLDHHMLATPSETTVIKMEDGLPAFAHLRHSAYKYACWDETNGYSMSNDPACGSGSKVLLNETYIWENDTNQNAVAELSTDEYAKSYITRYSIYGQPLETKDAKGHVTKIYYGSATSPCSDQYSYSKSTLPTCAEDNDGNQVKAYYDNYRRMDTMADANGIETYYHYDNLNRLKSVTSNLDNGYINTTYNYGLDGPDSVCHGGLVEGEEQCMNWVQTRSNFDDNSNNDAVARSYVDGLGRPWQTKALESDSNAIKVKTNYNERGFVDNRTEPEDSPISWVTKMLAKLRGENIEDLLLKYDEKDDSKDGEGGESVKFIYYDDPTGRVWKTFPYSVYSPGDENYDCNSTAADCTQAEYSPSDWIIQDEACRTGPDYTCVFEVDTEGKFVQTKINKMGHTVSARNPYGSTVRYAPDVLGQVIDVWDERGRRSRHNVYDELGRLVETVDLNSGKTVYSYDENGNVLTVLEAEGTSDERAKTFVYDNLDRVTIVCLDGNKDGDCGDASDDLILKNYYDSYDGNRNQADKCGAGASTYGYLCKVEEYVSGGQGTSIEYMYNSKGQVTELTEKINQQTYVTSYTYDLAGNVETITYPNDDGVEYEYNRLGQLEYIDGTGSNPMGRVEFEYNPEGTIDYIDFPNGATQEFTYTDKNWVEQITVTQGSTTLFDELYQYKDSGNLKNITDLTTDKSAWFAYDGLYRLERFGNTGFTRGYYGDNFGYPRYEYDEVGNRANITRVSGDGAGIIPSKIGYAYEDTTPELGELNDRLTKTYDPDTGETVCDYSYDNHGNMDGKDCPGEGETVYTYDVNNMISRIALPNGKVMEFKYDALGRRVYKNVYSITIPRPGAQALKKGVKTTYVYGAGNNPIMVMEDKYSIDIPNEDVHIQEAIPDGPR